MTGVFSLTTRVALGSGSASLVLVGARVGQAIGAREQITP